MNHAARYAKVPATLKVCEKVAPGCNGPLFQSPVADVVVCATESALVQTTVWLAVTLIDAGAKLKLALLTLC